MRARNADEAAAALKKPEGNADILGNRGFDPSG
jgi:hypothetical protein